MKPVEYSKKIGLSSGFHTYCDIGHAERTILLLHGFAFRPGMYPLMNALKTDFRVIVPDLPFSTDLDYSAPHTLDGYVDFLLEFVQALGLAKISTFGNSVGGTLALLCGYRNPGLFDRLIVRCPLWSRKQLPEYLQNEPLLKMHHTLSGNDLYARSALKLFYYFSTRMSPVAGKSIGKSIPFEDGQIDPVVMSRFLGRLVQVEFEEKLRSIQNKTLILWGTMDSFVESKWGIYLDELLIHSQYVEMTGEYHNISTSNPEKLAGQILKFTSEKLNKSI